MRLAAKLAEMPVEEFIALNPGFSRPVIRADETPRIVLPADRVDVFHENLTKYDDKSLVSWQTYQPRQGDSLEGIAKQVRASAWRSCKEVNGITPRARAHARGARRARPTRAPSPSRPAADHVRAADPERPGARTLRAYRQGGETAAGHRRALPGRRSKDLRRWNKIGHLLRAGQRLVIFEPILGTAESSARV